MTNEEKFKQIRRKYQGKYFKESIGSRVTIYRHIIKIDFYGDSLDHLIFHYYYYYYPFCYNEQTWSIKYKIEAIDGRFGERISASEYKKGLNNRTNTYK